MPGPRPLDEAGIRALLRAAGHAEEDDLVRHLVRVAPRLAQWAELNRRGEGLLDEPAVAFDLPLRRPPDDD